MRTMMLRPTSRLRRLRTREAARPAISGARPPTRLTVILALAAANLLVAAMLATKLQALRLG